MKSGDLAGQCIVLFTISEPARSNKPSQFWRNVAQRCLAEKLFCYSLIMEYLLKKPGKLFLKVRVLRCLKYLGE